MSARTAAAALLAATLSLGLGVTTVHAMSPQTFSIISSASDVDVTHAIPALGEVAFDGQPTVTDMSRQVVPAIVDGGLPVVGDKSGTPTPGASALLAPATPTPTPSTTPSPTPTPSASLAGVLPTPTPTQESTRTARQVGVAVDASLDSGTDFVARSPMRGVPAVGTVDGRVIDPPIDPADRAGATEADLPASVEDYSRYTAADTASIAFRALEALKDAFGFVGGRYVWGGTTPAGFDCSGLVQYVYRAHNLPLPRTANLQYHAVNTITPGQAVPGDLVFFFDETGFVYHVALYAGNGMIVEAQNPRTGIVYDRIWSTRIAYGTARNLGSEPTGVDVVTPDASTGSLVVTRPIVTPTPTPTPTSTPSATPSVTPSPTPTVTPTPTPSVTPSGTPTPTPTDTMTPTPSPSATPSDTTTPTASGTPTPTPTVTITPTVSATATPSAIVTPTPTPTATATPTPTATATPTETATPTPTATATPTTTPTGSATP